MRFRSLSPIAPTLLVAFALGAAAQDVTGTILIDTRTVTFPKPGIVDIYCHLHPNMAAAMPSPTSSFPSRTTRGPRQAVTKPEEVSLRLI